MFGKCPKRIVVFSSAVINDAQSKNIPIIAVIFIFIIPSVTERDHEINKVRLSSGPINISVRDERFRVQSRDAAGSVPKITGHHEEGSVVAELDIQLLHSLKPARVGPRRPCIGTASRMGNVCAAFYWSGGIPNVVGSRLWRREVPF